MATNPPWTYEELVLATDLIDRRDWRGGNAQTPEVIALSNLLRAANYPGLESFDESFRSVNSISMKLGNLKGANQTVEGGLKAIPREIEVVAHFLENREVMRALAESLRQGVPIEQPSTDSEALDDEETEAALEGGPSYVTTLRRERSRSLRKEKLKQANRDGIPIACEACGFDFFATYGERGRSYIEVHHRTPLHVSGPTNSSVDDLALLCANCHRMVHRSGWVTVEEISALVASSASGRRLGSHLREVRG